MAIEIRLVSPEWTTALGEYFDAIEPEERHFFHPHPFTREYAFSLSHYEGRDLYYLLLENAIVIGYGMLRGWDEGYSTPSLGISIHRNYQGKGCGEAFMHFLHCAAKINGARSVRLRVYERNVRALALYRRLGYRFEGALSGQMLGVLDLYERESTN